jgi:hypothetical protein
MRELALERVGYLTVRTKAFLTEPLVSVTEYVPFFKNFKLGAW